MCALFVCLSSQCFFLLKTVLCGLMIEDKVKTGRKTLTCNPETAHHFPLLEKAFLCPSSWVKELLLFSTK